MPSNLKDHVLVASAKNLDERDQAANTCVVKLGIHIPALVDDMRDSAERAYTGWPDRLYVVDQAGRVAYKSKAGPFGFDPEEMAKVLRSLITPGRNSS